MSIATTRHSVIKRAFVGQSLWTSWEEAVASGRPGTNYYTVRPTTRGSVSLDAEAIMGTTGNTGLPVVLIMDVGASPHTQFYL